MLFYGNTPYRNEVDDIARECSTCRWYQVDADRDEDYCTNEASENYGEYTPFQHHCEEWEEAD